ncbi:hypothetical protein A9Q98_00235 [Thalassotalea sp. 42_200_T64]|nr:hypothetical protein A9Q98_00235 [Thalassotalea sp. 42_200_T64]
MNFSDNLLLIDVLLMYTGSINRKQLMELTGMSIATATRTFKTYRERYPDNINYEVGNKRYEKSSTFNPGFDFNVESALALIAYGRKIEPSRYSNTIGLDQKHNCGHQLSKEISSILTRAIYSSSRLLIHYLSSNSDNEIREIVPTAIFESRNRWYVRVCVLEDNSYKNFKINRVNKVITSKSIGNISIPEDVKWKAPVILTLGPHPKHGFSKGLKRDLGLDKKPLFNLQTTDALAGFLLSEWAVDCSEDSSLDPYYFQYQLLNLYDLKDVSSMVISPGYAIKRKVDIQLETIDEEN